jgi:hypothetical protein
VYTYFGCRVLVKSIMVFSIAVSVVAKGTFGWDWIMYGESLLIFILRCDIGTRVILEG